MKKINTKAFILPLLVVLFVGISSCTKDDGPIKKEYLDLIDAVPVIATTVDATGSQAIDMLNLDAFSGKFTVSMFFPNAVTPEKVDVVVRKNGGTGSNVKVFQAGVTTYPSSFTITAEEIEALFGSPIVLGDSYDFSADIYANGKKYEALPVGGAPNSSGPAGMPGYSYTARFGAICAYNPAIYEGDFEVVTDEWADFSPGEIVTLTKVSDNSFSFIDPYAVATTPIPIIVNVNTGNNNIAIAKMSIGSRWGWTTDYTNAFVATAGSAASSFVSPCDELVTLNMSYAVDQGTFGGTYLLVLKKL